MNVIKLILKWLGAVLLVTVGVIFFIVGLALCMTIIGLVPGFLMVLGSLSFIVTGFALVAPDTARRIGAWRDRTKARLASRVKV